MRSHRFIFPLHIISDRLVLYATVFALTDLLKLPQRTNVKVNTHEANAISRIEVQLLYLEGLISSSCLASSAEGSRRLSDLLYLLHYVGKYRNFDSPVGVVQWLCRLYQDSMELGAS